MRVEDDRFDEQTSPPAPAAAELTSAFLGSRPTPPYEPKRQRDGAGHLAFGGSFRVTPAPRDAAQRQLADSVGKGGVAGKFVAVWLESEQDA